MNIMTLPTCLLIGALVLPFAASAGDAATDSDRSHPANFVKDSIITTKIKAKLGEDTISSLIHISVDTDDMGSVTLGGKAKTQDDADRAVAIARGTEGVTAVNSAISIGGKD